MMEGETVMTLWLKNPSWAASPGLLVMGQNNPLFGEATVVGCLKLNDDPTATVASASGKENWIWAHASQKTFQDAACF